MGDRSARSTAAKSSSRTSRWMVCSMLPHVLFYEVVSVIRCVMPYNYRTMLEMLVGKMLEVLVNRKMLYMLLTP